MPWQVIPLFHTSPAPISALEHLYSLSFHHPRVSMRASSSPAWDSFGVRDPAILVDAEGYLVKDNGQMVVYFTGSSEQGRTQGVGRAVSNDEGDTWQREPLAPVLAPQPGQWDSSVSSTAWCIKMPNGIYHLYYRGAIAPDEDAIGLATSQDGITFTRFGEKPILGAQDFKGLTQPTAFMGVLNVIRTLENKYLLTFEGSSAKHQGYAQIFGAISEDGIHFEPLNDGQAIFSVDQVQSCKLKQVANPRLTLLKEAGVYILVYNGADSSAMYHLNIAFSHDLVNWWEHPSNPILMPSFYPPDGSFSGRLEGGILLKEELEAKSSCVQMTIMAIPKEGPSHRNAVIGQSKGQTDYPFPKAFSVIAQNSDQIAITSEDGRDFVTLFPKVNTFPPRIHFPFPTPFDGLEIDLKIASHSRGETLLNFGEELNDLFSYEGLSLRFAQGQVQIWRGTALTRQLLIHTRWGKYIHQMPPKWRGWQHLTSYPENKWQQLHLEKKEQGWQITLNGQNFESQLKTPFRAFCVMAQSQLTAVYPKRINYAEYS